MQASDREEFKLELGKLCAGFNVPLTKIREEGYWAGFVRMSIGQLRRAVEYALSEHYLEEDLPTVGKIWKIHRGDAAPTSNAGHVQNPAERLCEHVMRTLGARLTPKQIRMPWTYIGSVGGEITGVIIPADGDAPSYRMMLTDIGSPQLPLT
jgi:hypothetical protein